jgi:pimeloyl-ACP methyl ester carboxylesterase
MAFAEFSDVRCYYEVLGQGPPLVLIPGLRMSCRSWDSILPRLSRHFTLILPDNRGVGLSVAKRLPRSVADLSADLVELLDHLQIDRAHVLGLSLGGIIAQRFAIDHPSRVDRLVLVSCTDRFSPYLHQVTLLLRHALRPFSAENFHRAVELLGSSPKYFDAHAREIEHSFREKQDLNDRKIMAIQLRCLACSELDPSDYRVLRPTLVVAGEDDRLIPACYARDMAEKIPGSQFLLLRGVGHNPLEESPDNVLPQITDFLQASRGDTTSPSHGDQKDQALELSL